MKNQCNIMLHWLKNRGDLSTLEAIERIGTTRPSNLVLHLRRKNHIITTHYIDSVNQYGEPIRYGVYHYVGEKDSLADALRDAPNG